MEHVAELAGRNPEQRNVHWRSAKRHVTWPFGTADNARLLSPRHGAKDASP